MIHSLKFTSYKFFWQRVLVALAIALPFIFDIPLLAAERAIPALTGPVMDEAELLNESEHFELERRIRSYLPTVQIQVWTVDSLEGEPIESLSIRATDKWKLGTEKKDNGVLILVAKKDRATRIEVGQGLEGDIPDIIAKRIIEEGMIPSFAAGDFAAGLNYAAQKIYERAGGQPSNLDLPMPGSRKKGPAPIALIIFILIFLFISFLRTLFGSGRRGGPPWFGGGFGGGGSSSWGGGGGFGGWSGGGGGFSGGGASGRW